MLLNAVTKYGDVSGVEENGIAVYKGVPYAKPPVGERRFMAPQEPDTWSGVLECSTYPLAPIQLRRIIFPDGSIRQDKGKRAEDSEDCLYLNIFTPAGSTTDNLPVLLWIFGGGFGSGHCSADTFRGYEINKRGVILVTVNYRLGPLGFISHPALTDRDPAGATGNYGLLDQAAAIKWVKENIAAFGGDPERITIFGHSAGGMSTKFMLVSPKARGNFARAIVHSGGGLNGGDPTRPLELIRRLTQETMDKLGWTIDDLLMRDAVEVNQLMYETSVTLPEGRMDSIFKPCVDGQVLPEIPEELLKRGEYGPADVIIGTVPGDAGMFCRYVQTELDPADRELYMAFSKVPQYSVGRQFTRLGEKPIRAYYFARDQRQGKGTPHGSELPYVFGTLHTRKIESEPYDIYLSNLMTDYWTNFAATGDPNAEGLPYWPVFDSKEEVLLFGDKEVSTENIIKTPKEDRLVDFTIEHPGILYSMQGF